MNTKDLLIALKIPIVPSYSIGTLTRVLDYQKGMMTNTNSEVSVPLVETIKSVEVTPIEKEESPVNSVGINESSICKIAKKDLKTKKGDVFMAHGTNGKRRPFVVAKMVKNGVYAIPLTTTQDAYTLLRHHSRFLSEGYFSNYMVFVKLDAVRTGFSSILDDNRSLNKAIELIKEKIIKEIL